MSYGRHVQAYRSNQVMTADPGAILLMLYQGTIDFVRQAKQGLEKKDMAEKGLYINKALAIVSELLAGLNFEIGGDVARNLEALYLFMINQITNANLHNDPEPLENVLRLLSTLKEGWEGAVTLERQRMARETGEQTGIAAQPLPAERHEPNLAARA